MPKTETILHTDSFEQPLPVFALLRLTEKLLRLENYRLQLFNN
jgi:hypothetical protein